jgi:succinate dehydrogenase/fumarate reductase flavoprotein subunit
MPVFSRLAVAVQLFSIIFTPALAASAPQNYDYVIVGGGITGLVVANRLTEDKNGKLPRAKPLLVRQADTSHSECACG